MTNPKVTLYRHIYAVRHSPSTSIVHGSRTRPKYLRNIRASLGMVGSAEIVTDTTKIALDRLHFLLPRENRVCNNSGFHEVALYARASYTDSESNDFCFHEVALVSFLSIKQGLKTLWEVSDDSIRS